jgi:3-oxoacyl-[acyl-carrier protein] reductase
VRSVVVTGASRGLGLGIARRLAASGFRVVAVARTQGDGLTAAMAEAAQDGAGSLHFQPCDLADLAALPALAKELRRAFGPLYGLVNNAGLGTSGMLATMQDSQIERLVRLNLVSPMTLTKYLVRPMMAAQSGRIVSISSVVASTGYSGLSVYSATKAALVGFTRSLAREVGSLGITVNAVAPGFIETDMTSALSRAQRVQIARRSALGRLPDAEDVAASVGFLLSDQARNITGTVMTVDAGTTA